MFSQRGDKLLGRGGKARKKVSRDGDSEKQQSCINEGPVQVWKCCASTAADTHHGGGGSCLDDYQRSLTHTRVQTLENSATQADKDVLFFFCASPVYSKNTSCSLVSIFRHRIFLLFSLFLCFSLLVWLFCPVFAQTVLPPSKTRPRSSPGGWGLKIGEKLIKCRRTAGW